MGLLIHTTFETREGIQLQSVYSRIVSILCEFRGYYTYITVNQDIYVNREKRVGGYTPLSVPIVGNPVVLKVQYNSNWGDIAFLYTKVKERLAEMGITAEDVLEDPPQPPPAPEPAPEPSPEPAPAEEPPAETPPS